MSSSPADAAELPEALADLVRLQDQFESLGPQGKAVASLLGRAVVVWQEQTGGEALRSFVDLEGMESITCLQGGMAVLDAALSVLAERLPKWVATAESNMRVVPMIQPGPQTFETILDRIRGHLNGLSIEVTLLAKAMLEVFERLAAENPAEGPA